MKTSSDCGYCDEPATHLGQHPYNGRVVGFCQQHHNEFGFSFKSRPRTDRPNGTQRIWHVHGHHARHFHDTDGAGRIKYSDHVHGEDEDEDAAPPRIFHREPKPTDRAARIRPTLQRMASGEHGTTPEETEAARKMLERYKSQRMLRLLDESFRKSDIRPEEATKHVMAAGSYQGGRDHRGEEHPHDDWAHGHIHDDGRVTVHNRHEEPEDFSGRHVWQSGKTPKHLHLSLFGSITHPAALSAAKMANAHVANGGTMSWTHNASLRTGGTAKGYVTSTYDFPKDLPAHESLAGYLEHTAERKQPGVPDRLPRDIQQMKSQRQLHLFEDSVRKAEDQYGMRAVYSKKCGECGHGVNAHNAQNGKNDPICMDCNSSLPHTYVDPDAPSDSPLHPSQRPNSPSHYQGNVSQPERISAAQWHAPQATPGSHGHMTERHAIITTLHDQFHGTATSKVNKSRRKPR